MPKLYGGEVTTRSTCPPSNLPMPGTQSSRRRSILITQRNCAKKADSYRENARLLFLGSTGCQPVVRGSLPRTCVSEHIYVATFGTAAECNRLAACAPQRRFDSHDRASSLTFP